MKTKIWITGALIALNLSAFAQFKGLITYQVDVTLSEGMAAAAAFMPTELKIASDGQNVAMEMDGMQGMHMLTNYSEKLMYIYSKTQGIGMKTAMDQQGEKAREKLADANIQVTRLEQTKNILGYECAGYMISMDSSTSEVYVTDDIVLNAPGEMESYIARFPEGADIKGFALYVKTTVHQDGEELVMVMEATSIDEENVPEEMMKLRDVEYMEME